MAIGLMGIFNYRLDAVSWLSGVFFGAAVPILCALAEARVTREAVAMKTDPQPLSKKEER